MTTSIPSRIAGENWLPITLAHVCLSFLRAEWHKAPQGVATKHNRELIDNPNLDDAGENTLRRRLLGTWRERIIGNVPNDTNWWRVQYLRTHHLHELLVINSYDWRDPGDHNELLAVSRRRGGPLRTAPPDCDQPILWGHDREGPFTILEGNNRLVNYCASGVSDLFAVECFIGISHSSCLWHLPNRRFFGVAPPHGTVMFRS